MTNKHGTGYEIVRARELEDLDADLEDLRSRRRRHLLWAVLGFSPTGLLLLPGVIASGSATLLGALVAGVVLVEGVRGARAHKRAREVEGKIAQLAADPGSDAP